MPLLFKDYLPAELKANKDNWYIRYYVKNPYTNKLQRKTIKVNRIKNISERKKYATKLVQDINNKLQNGWNPFHEQEAPKAFYSLIDALEIFLSNKLRELTSEDSHRTYKSQVSMLNDYIFNVIRTKDMYVISFDTNQARAYMDYVYNVKKVSSRTFNNYKATAGIIWNWFVENLYCKVNVFKSIRKKIEPVKKRKFIPLDYRKTIKNYLIENNEIEFLCMLLICFHGFVRPKEICSLKAENIVFEKKIIFIEAINTKDKSDRIVTIPDELMNYLKMINIINLPPDFYVFSRNFKPGKERINPRLIAKKWNKIRNKLRLPKEFQFYSLKDTGIIQKFKDGINALDIRNQAGHSSLDQTNQYAIYANPFGSKEISDKSTDF